MKNLMENMLAHLRNGRSVAGLLLLLGVLVACGEDPRQLFETAQFEEQQRNRVHAQELYEQIIQQHPDSEYAGKARERLAALKAEHPEGQVQEIQ